MLRRSNQFKFTAVSHHSLNGFHPIPFPPNHTDLHEDPEFTAIFSGTTESNFANTVNTFCDHVTQHIAKARWRPPLTIGAAYCDDENRDSAARLGTITKHPYDLKRNENGAVDLGRLRKYLVKRGTEGTQFNIISLALRHDTADDEISNNEISNIETLVKEMVGQYPRFKTSLYIFLDVNRSDQSGDSLSTLTRDDEGTPLLDGYSVPRSPRDGAKSVNYRLFIQRRLDPITSVDSIPGSDSENDETPVFTPSKTQSSHNSALTASRPSSIDASVEQSLHPSNTPTSNERLGLSQSDRQEDHKRDTSSDIIAIAACLSTPTDDNMARLQKLILERTDPSLELSAVTTFLQTILHDQNKANICNQDTDQLILGRLTAYKGPNDESDITEIYRQFAAIRQSDGRSRSVQTKAAATQLPAVSPSSNGLTEPGSETQLHAQAATDIHRAKVIASTIWSKDVKLTDQTDVKIRKSDFKSIRSQFEQSTIMENTAMARVLGCDETANISSFPMSFFMSTRGKGSNVATIYELVRLNTNADGDCSLASLWPTNPDELRDIKERLTGALYVDELKVTSQISRNDIKDDERFIVASEDLKNDIAAQKKHLAVEQVKELATLFFQDDNIGILYKKNHNDQDLRDLALLETNPGNPVKFFVVHSGGDHFEQWQIHTSFQLNLS